MTTNTPVEAAGPAEPAASGGRALWVLRHAKTVVDPRRVAPTTNGGWPRGRRDAGALGRRLATDRMGLAAEELPELVLCSTAVRTRQTVELVLAELADAPVVDFRRAVYYASPDQVLAEIRTVPDDVRSLMVVGHNPTVHALAAGLGTDDDRLAVEARGFPTCALAVFGLPAGRWSDVADGVGRLVGFFTPPY